jgi:hypothetical protein
MKNHLFLIAALSLMATAATTTTIRAQDDEHHQVVQADNPFVSTPTAVLTNPAIGTTELQSPATLNMAGGGCYGCLQDNFAASEGVCWGCIQENFVQATTTTLHAVATSKLFYLLGFVSLLLALSYRYVRRSQQLQPHP